MNRKIAIALIAGLLILGVLAFGLGFEAVQHLTQPDLPLGAHPLASGAYAVDSDPRNGCSAIVDHSPLWQAYLAEKLTSGAKPPALRFSIIYQRQTAKPFSVTANFSVVDVASGKNLYQKQSETWVRQPKLKYRGITLMTFDPGESDYQNAEDLLALTLIDVGAVAVISEMPEKSAVFAPVLIETLRRESANKDSYYTADGQLVYKFTDVHPAAIEALAKFAPKSKQVVAQLAEALSDKDPFVSADVAGILGKIKPAAVDALPALRAALKSEQTMVRNAAAYALGEMGPPAEPAIPELAGLLKSQEDAVRSAAYGALLKIGAEKKQISPTFIAELKPALPMLIGFLSSDDKWQRRIIPNVIGWLGAAAKPAVPVLTQLLSDKTDYQIREAAAKALAQIGPDASEAAPALLQAFGDPEGLVAYESIKTIGALGPAAKDAVPVLMQTLQHQKIDLRTNAIEALGQMGAAGGPAAAPLGGLLKDTNPSVREASARALSQLGPVAKPALPDLLAAVDDPVANVARYAVIAIGNVGADARASIALGRAMRHRNKDVQIAAIEVVAAMKPRPAECSAVLTECLNSSDAQVRAAAVKAMSSQTFKPSDMQAIVPGLLITLVNGKDVKVRQSAEDSLKQLGDAAAPAIADFMQRTPGSLKTLAPVLNNLTSKGKAVIVQALIETYQRGDTMSRNQIIAALQDFGPAAEPAIPIIVDALQEENAHLPREVLRKLGAVAAPGLAAGLKHKHERVRHNCANLLADLGPKAKPAVPALTEALKDYKVSFVAALALCKIGSAASDSVPALLDAISNIRIDDRIDVAKAMVNMGVGATGPLMKGLKHKNQYAAQFSAIALGLLGRDAETATGALKEAAAGKDSYVRDLALKALEQIRAAK